MLLRKILAKIFFFKEEDFPNNNTLHGTRKRVIIVGCGFAGGTAANVLRKDPRFEVIIIDAKSFFESTPSIPKILVNPAYAANVVVPHVNYLKKEKFIHARVEELLPDGSSLLLSNGDEIKFDYLLLCTGSSYTDPIKVNTQLYKYETRITDKAPEKYIADRLQDISNTNRDIEIANTILIVGGGPVGVEIAGEIVHKYPNKEVIIVTNAKALLHQLDPTSQKAAESFFSKEKSNYYI